MFVKNKIRQNILFFSKLNLDVVFSLVVSLGNYFKSQDVIIVVLLLANIIIKHQAAIFLQWYKK